MGVRSPVTALALLPSGYFENELEQIVSSNKSCTTFPKSWWRVGRRNYLVTGKHEGDRSPATHYLLHHNELTPGGRSARKTGQFYVDKKKTRLEIRLPLYTPSQKLNSPSQIIFLRRRIYKSWRRIHRQMDISIWPFLLVFVGLLAVVIISISWRVWQAANENPVDVVKSE